MIGQCQKCKNQKFKMMYKEPHFGLYCADCNCWLGWIKTEELPFYMNDKVEATDEVKALVKKKLEGKTFIYDANLNYVFDGRDGEKGFCIDWDSNKGFGQLTIIQSNDSGCLKLFAETEGMASDTDKKFIKDVFDKLIENMKVIE